MILDTTRLNRDTGSTPNYHTVKAAADYVAWRANNPR